MNYKKLIFAIKKHNATNLHYDLRFELKGVLISWFISYEGPSMNPNIQRIAEITDIHQLAHIYREGYIPEGKYGAGELIVWDYGDYSPIGGGQSRLEDENILTEMFNKGNLNFNLTGQKLRGEFSLIITKNPRHWILKKEMDDFISLEDLTKYNKSAISNKSIESIQEMRKKKKEMEIMLDFK